MGGGTLGERENVFRTEHSEDLYCPCMAVEVLLDETIQDRFNMFVNIRKLGL